MYVTFDAAYIRCHPALPQLHRYVGTNAYMAPERVEGKPYTVRGDVRMCMSYSVHALIGLYHVCVRVCVCVCVCVCVVG